MRFSGVFTAVMFSILVSGCSGTWNGMKQDFSSASSPTAKPTASPIKAIKLPTGYYCHNHRFPDCDGAQEEPVVAASAPIEEMIAPAPVEIAPAPVAMAPEPVVENYGTVAEEVYFKHGSSKISPNGKTKIKKFAKGVKKKKDLSLTVVGHASERVDHVTDPVQRKMINLEMSQKRATAVTSELKNSGVNPSYVKSISKGDEEPNPHPGKLSQEAADRRVEIYEGQGQ